MASRFSWLSTCKHKQLASLARATGINSSGTKPVLISHLLDGLSQTQTPLPRTTTLALRNQKQQNRQDGYNILSIDMGIRNLAYCHLHLPPTWLHPNPNKPPPLTPTLTHWSRIAISSPSPSPSSSPKESFTPTLYAPHAHTFLTTHILPHNPTHILIERQRFRSMGGSSVQEWTLRVNMFEAMLYATLHTYSELGMWKGEVVPVLPSKVVKYWVDGLDDKEEDMDMGMDTMEVEEKGKGKKKGKRVSPTSKEKSKARKMGIVRDMVKEGSGVRLEGEAKEMGNLVMGKAEGEKKKRADKGKGLGKFDDLADCLLQGLAWVKWEENKRLVWEKGVEALVELMEEDGKGRGEG
ncbi:MAG: hypothetical protein Q9178_002439 [Gyalolechia marmorata]